MLLPLTLRQWCLTGRHKSLGLILGFFPCWHIVDAETGLQAVGSSMSVWSPHTWRGIPSDGELRTIRTGTPLQASTRCRLSLRDAGTYTSTRVKQTSISRDEAMVLILSLCCQTHPYHLLAGSELWRGEAYLFDSYNYDPTKRCTQKHGRTHRALEFETAVSLS